MSDQGKRIVEAYGALLSDRSSWDSLWQELADVCHPRRAEITSRSGPGTPPDRENIANAFDGTAMRAADTLARGQAARITPMGSRWFAFRPPPQLADNAAAQAWYQRAGEITAQKLYASNFYSVQFETYQDRGVFGTAAKEILAGPDGRGLHFREFPVGSYCIADNDFGQVDTLYRAYKFTARQILGAFPDSCPDRIRKEALDPTKASQRHEIIHGVFPRLDRDPRKSDSKSKAFASFHVLKEDAHILKESGYDEFPCAVSRWQRWGESPYGWAPAYHALPEASQANYLETLLDTLAETAAFPRVKIPDGTLKSDIDFKALGLTFFDPAMGSGPEEWLTGGRYDIGKDRLNDKRQAIESAFFTNLFNPVAQLSDEATATQVRAIVSESRELFHPIFANMVREDQTPTLRRAFSLLLRSGEIPPPPPAVYQRDNLGAFIAEPDVEMVSQMALALEQNHLARLNDVLAVLTPIAGVDPSVLDYLDLDRVGPSLNRYMGLPEDFIRPPEQIAEIRGARAQAQQAEAAKQATEGVRNLGGIDQVGRLADMAAGVIPPGQ